MCIYTVIVHINTMNELKKKPVKEKSLRPFLTVAEQEFRAFLEKKAVDNKIPIGGQEEMAGELGITPGRISQLLIQLRNKGYISTYLELIP